MIPARAHSPTLRAGGYSPDPEAIVTFLDPHAKASERSCHGFDAVRFLYAQLSCAFDRALPVRAARREREQRQLVDHQRDLLCAHTRCHELRGVHLEVADRLAPGGPPPVEDSDARAHPLQRIEQARSSRIEA